MYYSEHYRSAPSTLKDNPLVNLVLIAMNNNRFSSQKYKLLMDMTEDINIKNPMQYAYNNELKHYKLFKQIYKKLTGQSVEIPIPNIKINNSLVDVIEDCIDKELEEVTLYQKIGTLVSSEQVRNTIRHMIIDKQKNTAALNFLYARESSSRNPIPTTTNNVTVTFKTIKTEKKYISEDLRIPILNGIKNIKIQNKINTSLQDDVLEFQRQMEEAADEDGSRAEKKGKKFIKYIISNNSSITYNKNNIISISNLIYEFVNGRHSYIRSTYNFDINTGKSLGLRDLFNPGTPYRELINNEIRKQLAANKDIYPPDSARNFKGISEDHPFYLEDGNIVLFFGFNEIAPTISEIPVIKLPFRAFSGSINPIFLS